MKKYRVLCLATVFILALSTVALAQIDASVELSPFSSMEFSSLLGNKVTVDDWSILATVRYQAAEDLLVFFNYTTANGQKVAFGSAEAVDFSSGERFNRRITEGAVAYKFMDEDALTIYGGLGYQLSSLDFKHPSLGGAGETQKLSGQGFNGIVNVDLAVMDGLKANAFINGSPWLVWKYTFNDKTTESIAGSGYNYQVALEYEVMPGYSIRAGYHGGRMALEDFTHNLTTTFDKTKGTFQGITGGVTVSF